MSKDFGCVKYPECTGKPKEVTMKDVHQQMFSQVEVLDPLLINEMAMKDEEEAFKVVVERQKQIQNNLRYDLRINDNDEEKKKSLITDIVRIGSRLPALISLRDYQREEFWKVEKDTWQNYKGIDYSISLAKICHDIELVEPDPIGLPVELAIPLGKSEAEPLVSTKEFQYLYFPFEFLNPVQSAAVQYIDCDANLVVASPTASGKTVIAEMTMAKALTESDSAKVVYLAPMKALTEEKYTDFTDEEHPFSGLKVSVMTGDYEMTTAKKTEVKNASILLMTNEMLAVRCRMSESEKSEWLYNVKVLVVDEIHLLGAEGRGDNTEAALMMFSKINPDCRIVLLSATMPNVEELGKWIYILNGKPTKVIQSDYRPCEIEKHYVQLPPTKRYQEAERVRMDEVLNLVEQYPHDSWLVFSGTKTWGRKCESFLRDETNLSVKFINADLRKEEKSKLIADFEQGRINVLISTTVLAYGVNLPARRVIVVHQKYGIREMDVCDIQQMIGRGGRPKYDTKGDAYILIEYNEFNYWRDKIEAGEDIQSQFSERDVLEFHAVAEITNSHVKTDLDFYEWYSRSFASLQKKMPVPPDEVIGGLQMMGCVFRDKGYIRPTMLGKISTWMYYPPRIVAQWRQNVDGLYPYLNSSKTIMFEGRKFKISDIAQSLMFTYEINRDGFVSSREENRVSWFQSICQQNFGIDFSSDLPTLQDALALLLRINGIEDKNGLGVLQRNLSYDCGRFCGAVRLIAKGVNKVNIENEINAAELRIKYGVREKLISLVQIRGIGSVRAEKLYFAGIKSAADLADPKNEKFVLGILGEKVGKEILETIGKTA